jgi:hypothetical protein
VERNSAKIGVMPAAGQLLRCATVLAAGLAALSAIAACTIFNNVSAQPTDGGTQDDVAVGPDGGTLSFLDRDHAARACANAVSCTELGSSIYSSVSVPILGSNFSMCMDWLSGPLPPSRPGIQATGAILQCVANAATCSNALACLAYENLSMGDPRCADAGANYCAENGTVTLDCADTYAIHCGNAYFGTGSSCLVGSDKSAYCAVSLNCTQSVPTCTGTVQTSCDLPSGELLASDCQITGHTCGIDPMSHAASCLDGTVAEEDCFSEGFSSACASPDVTVCDGNWVSRFHCADLGGTCSTNGGQAHCVRPGDACSPFDPDINVCTGTTISLCIGGQKTTYDCSRIQLSCHPGSAGQTPYCGQ